MIADLGNLAGWAVLALICVSGVLGVMVGLCIGGERDA